MDSEPTVGLTRYGMTHNGESREYLVYIPVGYSEAETLPLLFAFHGNGGEPASFLSYADFRPVADRDGIVLVYPLGTLLQGEGTHWNPLLPTSEGNKSTADDFGFVDELITLLGTQLNIDETRVYATGYSNGAGLAYGLACYLSDRVTAVAPVSGSMWIEMNDNCAPSHPTSVAIFNGTNDFIRPYDGYPGYLMSVDAALGYWKTFNQVTDEPVANTFETNAGTVERSIYSGGTNGAEVALFKVVGGDHLWFDLSIEGKNLADTIWSFLSQFDRNGARTE